MATHQNQKSNGNAYRFMPGREPKEGDNRILLSSIRYSRKALPDSDKGFKAGIGIGPGQHMPSETSGTGFALSPGGVIVPARPNDNLETVKVRDYSFKDDNGKTQTRQYVDWVTFQKVGGELFAIRHNGDQEVYIEAWTGDFEKRTKEGTFQLIQFGLFNHGSVAYAGGEVIVNAPSKKLAKNTDDDQQPEGVRASKAELMGETKGDIVGGVPLWMARAWKLRYSEKDSESILVRQLGKFYLVLMKGGELIYPEMPAAKFERRFANLTVDQKLVPVPMAPAAVAA